MPATVFEMPETTQTNVGPMYRGVKIRQQFTSRSNGLCAVWLLAATYKRTLEIPLMMRIIDSATAEIVRSLTYTVRLQDNAWHRFDFDPIMNSAGRTFWFECEANTSRFRPMTLWANQRVISQTSRNNAAHPGTVCFKCEFGADDGLPMFESGWRVEDISDQGERVTHLYANDCYYAHLSIYRFASQFCQDGVVLDAGSGAGYGSAYLAEHGARRVFGCELSDKAVAFSNFYFPRDNLSYQVMDLQKIEGFTDRTFDLVFSSNVLEHIPDVGAFLRSAWSVLKTDGALVVGVPPIVRDVDWRENLANPYHLNIWTPRQWAYALGRFFEDVQPYHHGFGRAGVPLDFANAPEQCVIDENDFPFRPIDLDGFARDPTLTVVLVARNPRPAEQLPAPSAKLLIIDHSITRAPLAESK